MPGDPWSPLRSLAVAWGPLGFPWGFLGPVGVPWGSHGVSWGSLGGPLGAWMDVGWFWDRFGSHVGIRNRWFCNHLLRIWKTIRFSQNSTACERETCFEGQGVEPGSIWDDFRIVLGTLLGSKIDGFGILFENETKISGISQNSTWCRREAWFQEARGGAWMDLEWFWGRFWNHLGVPNRWFGIVFFWQFRNTLYSVHTPNFSRLASYWVAVKQVMKFVNSGRNWASLTHGFSVFDAGVFFDHFLRLVKSKQPKRVPFTDFVSQTQILFSYSLTRGVCCRAPWGLERAQIAKTSFHSYHHSWDYLSDALTGFLFFVSLPNAEFPNISFPFLIRNSRSLRHLGPGSLKEIAVGPIWVRLLTKVFLTKVALLNHVKRS